jgi:hypothetical protein
MLRDQNRFMWLSLMGLAAIGLYGISAPPAPPADNQAAGLWIVQQLDHDAVTDPERRERALNICISTRLDRDGNVNWISARGCYEGLLRS